MKYAIRVQIRDEVLSLRANALKKAMIPVFLSYSSYV